MEDRIALMNAELDAAERFNQARNRMNLTPVVDDDYEEMRHYYNSTLREFLRAIKKNRGETFFTSL